MAILNVNNLAEHGVITDMSPDQLPPNAWNNSKNVRFRDNQVYKFKGHSVYVTPPTNWDGGDDLVYFLLPVYNGTTYHWIYCGLKDVRVTDGSSDKEITRASGVYSATEDRNWTGGIIGGIPILNNGLDVPQMWNPVDFGTPGLLSDLSNWPASTTCGALRVYKNYLVALDVTKGGTRYPSLVKWSDSSGLGLVPQSWDETDNTTDAGENDLAESRGNINVGACLDCLPLRDTNIIYKDDSTWAMRFTGGNEIFTFYQIFKTQGALSRRCMAEFEGKHFVLSNGDVFVHDGNSAQSVISSRRRRELFSTMDSDNYERTFVFSNYTENEIWICYPEDGATDGLPNRALVWNWRHNAWGDRELPSKTPHISSGIVDVSVVGDPWTTNDGTWATWTIPWGETGFSPQTQSPLIASDKLYRGDNTDQFNGTDMESFLERTDIPLGNQDEFFRVKRLTPRIKSTGSVDIYVGSHQTPGDSANYQSPVSFMPGTDRKVDVRVSGTHLAVLFKSEDNIEWSLSGYDVEYEPISKR